MEGRKLCDVAREIRADWKNVHFGAEPYLTAMESLGTVDDHYFFEDGRSIVLYFLANASSWRGAVAKRVKAELKEMLKRK